MQAKFSEYLHNYRFVGKLNHNMSCSSSWLAAISHLKDPQILGTVAALSLAYAAYHTWRQQEIEKMQSQFACQSIELPVS